MPKDANPPLEECPYSGCSASDGFTSEGWDEDVNIVRCPEDRGHEIHVDHSADAGE